VDTQDDQMAGEARRYTAAIGDQVRVGIEYRGGWRPMFWFQLAKDGSLYLGPRFKSVTSVRKGFESTPGPVVTIDFGAGEPMPAPLLTDGTKVSFHSSGLITSAGERLWRPPLRHMRKQHRLISILFQHPTAFRVEKPKLDDVVLSYPVDEGFPLMCSVYIAPLEQEQPVVFEDARYQASLIFSLSGFDDGAARIVQVLFYDGRLQDWPDGTLLVFDALRREEGPPQPDKHRSSA
jgi:hypothetical protein